MEWFHTTVKQVMTVQLVIAAAMALVVVGFAIARTFERGLALPRDSSLLGRRLFAASLVTVTLVAALNYFYTSRSRQFLHRWDLFHTIMTTRYFDELGYLKLYECAYVFDGEGAGRRHFSAVPRIRDLDTLKYRATANLGQSSDCQARFSPERRAAFLRDLDFFFELTPKKSRWRRILTDKGYNGTPSYTVVMRTLVGDGELSLTRLRLLILLDVALILLAFYFVSRGFGWTTALVALTFFCVNFPNRFDHMGGSILRFDYVVLLIIGVCMMKRGRYAIAGALIALATIERGFPLLFAVGLFIKAVHDTIVNRQLERRYLWFFISFAVAAAAALAASLAAGGVEAWQDFAHNMGIHNQKSAGFRIGFQHMFMMDGNLSGPEGFYGYGHKAALLASRKAEYLLAVALFMAPLLLLVRRLSAITFAVVFFLLTFFLFFVATRYYYSVLVLLFLLDYDLVRERFYAVALALAFAMTAIAYAVFMRVGFAAFVYNTLLTTMLCGLFAYVLVALCLHHRAGSPGRDSTTPSTY